MDKVKQLQSSKKRNNKDDDNTELKKKLLATKLSSTSAFGEQSKTSERIVMDCRLTEIHELL